MISRLKKLPVRVNILVFLALLAPSYLLFQHTTLASRIAHHCYNPDELLENCFSDYYKETAHEHGTGAALSVLHRRMKNDPTLVTNCHEAMHEIGHEAYEEYGSIAEAYAHADYGCWGGYLHGVVEEALRGKTLKDIPAETLRTLCDAAKTEGEMSFQHFSCVHGVGHALMLVSYNDLPNALLRCDDLANEWETSQCVNGAFMQNMFSKYNDHESDYLPKDDLHFPCNIAREKDQKACYQVQGKLILDGLRGDMAKSFAFCASLTTQTLRSACGNGLGAAVSNRAAYVPAQVVKLCTLAGVLEEDCLYGAMTDLEGVAGDASLGEKVCALEPVEKNIICEGVLLQAHNDFPGSIKEGAN